MVNVERNLDSDSIKSFFQDYKQHTIENGIVNVKLPRSFTIFLIFIIFLLSKILLQMLLQQKDGQQLSLLRRKEKKWGTEGEY